MQQADFAAVVPASIAVKLEAGVDGDIAWWQHCVDVVNTLDAYRPERFAPSPPPLNSFYDDLVALSDEIMRPNEQVRSAFGKWRAHVTEIEAINARRLEVLADVARRLREMRERAVDVRQVDDLTRTVMGFIYAHYRTVPPENAKLRLWCQRAMRRFDLLPKEWREL